MHLTLPLLLGCEYRGEKKEPHAFCCSLDSSPSCEVCSILPLSSLPPFAQQSLGGGSSRDLLFKVLIPFLSCKQAALGGTQAQSWLQSPKRISPFSENGKPHFIKTAWIHLPREWGILRLSLLYMCELPLQHFVSKTMQVKRASTCSKQGRNLKAGDSTAGI